MSHSPTTPKRRFSGAYLLGFLLVALMGALLAAGSQALLFVDTNDFKRVVGHLHLQPLGDGLRWALPDRPFRMAGNPELASHLFSLAGWVQRYLPGGVFDLSRTALAAKCLLVLAAWLLARQCAAALRVGALGCTCMALAWLGVFFMAHNIGMAQSFYAEYAFLIGLPLLLIGLLAQRPRVRWLCLAVGALVCGLAKVQYFYVPLLVLGCVWVAGRWQRMPVDTRQLKWLLAIQVLCLVPLLIGKNAAFNAYHGVYLGSYLVLTPAQLDGLGVPADQRRCIGVDAWGSALSGPGGTQIEEVEPCFPALPRLGKGDVLRPYLHYPLALVRLAQYALPHHFTVHYFHVYPNLLYLKRQAGDARLQPVTQLLLQMTDARERYITPLAPVWLLAALVCFALSRRNGAEGLARLALAGLVLACLVASQVVIGLLGEGVRDLSKHLWGAQLALDMLVLLVALQILGAVRQRYPAKRPGAAPAPSPEPTEPADPARPLR